MTLMPLSEANIHVATTHKLLKPTTQTIFAHVMVVAATIVNEIPDVQQEVTYAMDVV